MEEREKQRDAALEEATALKEAVEAEAASTEEYKKRLEVADSQGRRIFEETQRLQIELRKLRVRYQVRGMEAGTADGNVQGHKHA